MIKYFDLLPESCFHELDSTGETILIKRGESGYYPSDKYKDCDYKELNKTLGVTDAQAEAMKAGSMFGWDASATNPAIWKENDFSNKLEDDKEDLKDLK